jgi:hypothetical protein
MDPNTVGAAAGAAAFVAGALQWARAHKGWPEWANALVVVTVAFAATVFSGVPVHPLSGFAATFGTILTASGAGGYLASALSHLPISSKVVPASNTKGAVPATNGGSK